MKKWGPSLLIFLAGLLIGTVIGWRCYEYHRVQMRDGERRAQRMMKMFSHKLDLTAEQQTALGKIFDDKRQKMKALRGEIRPRFEELRRATKDEIRKILRPDQMEKFNALETKWDERIKKRYEQNP